MGKLPLLMDVFTECANRTLSRHSELEFDWIPKKGGTSRTLIIHKQNDQGFDVGVDCEAYGLYPWAGDWHGAPWDDVADSSENLEGAASNVLGFLRSLLCAEGRLRVETRNRVPVRWFVEFCEPTGWAAFESMDLLFYNYFGRRSEYFLQNSHLQERGRVPHREGDVYIFPPWDD